MGRERIQVSIRSVMGGVAIAAVICAGERFLFYQMAPQQALIGPDAWREAALRWIVLNIALVSPLASCCQAWSQIGCSLPEGRIAGLSAQENLVTAQLIGHRSRTLPGPILPAIALTARAARACA